MTFLQHSSGIDPWGVYSVWRRHATVYQKTWLVNFLPPITEPLVYLLAFGYGITPMLQELIYQGEPISYRQFIGPSMMGIALLFQAFFEGAYGSFIRLHYQKTWHALLTAPLSYTEIFMGDWIWAATRGLISATITGVVTILFGSYTWVGLLVSLPLMIIGSLLFAAMGLLAAGWVDTVDQINVPIFGLVVPMFVLCGTYFPRDNLPPFLAIPAGILPLSSLVDLLRWPLGLPHYWGWELLWLIFLGGLLTYLSWQKIAHKLFG